MKTFTILSFIVCSTIGFSQTTIIPDNNFANYLQTAVPECMDGNELNIPCANNSTITQMILGNQGLTNLSGVEHFSNLTHLLCGMNEITTIPALPPNLQFFIAGFNELSSLPDLPPTLLLLDCSHNQVVQLPNLPNGLTELMCFHNQLTTLPNLPNSLTHIVASNNQISSLGMLPSQLNYFDISYNALTSLPDLPGQLEMLACTNNQLTSLPDLPNLKTLRADTNNIKCFPTFPPTINTPVLDFVYLTISDNPFTCLPNHTVAMTDDLLDIPVCSDSPADDIHNCATGLGITIEDFQFQLYPNPNNGTFSMNFSEAANIEIYNALGQSVQFSTSKEHDLQRISLHENLSGLYFVKLISPNSIKTVRMVILD